MTTENTELIAELLVSLKDRIGATKVSKETIHIILKEAMELVEELNIPGSEKRDNVMAVIKALVNDLVLDGEEKRLIMEIIDNKILENTMDLIVQATKGEFNINNKKTQKQLSDCFTVSLRILVSLVSMCKKPKAKQQEVKITKSDNQNKV